MSERSFHRPVITPAGIMPGGSEMTEWHGRVPFPGGVALELKRAELLYQIEQRKQEKAKELPAAKAEPKAVTHGSRKRPTA